MKKEKSELEIEAGDRTLYPQKVVENVIGKQHRIGREVVEEYVE
jgi:hypothetical protein